MHLALICDGTRRYAKKNNINLYEGYALSSKLCRNIVRWCIDREDIKTVSIFALSLKNLENRPPLELKILCELFTKEIQQVIREMKKGKLFKKARVQVLSLINDRVPSSLMNEIRRLNQLRCGDVKGATQINILFGYDGQEEIENAAKKMSVNHNKFRDNLLVKKDVDLMVRTGGEKRISGFLLYQCSQAQIYFEDKMFPECNESDFSKWIDWFNSCERRLGR